MLAQRKRICGKEQNLNGGLQNWLSTFQRSPFFRHHFSKSTTLFPRLLCVGRMRVDMHDNVRWGPGGTRGCATTVFTTSCQSWASSSDKHANSSSTPTLPLPAVTTFRLLRNSCFAWSFLQILPFSPCSTCNSQASWRNWLWWWWWRWVTRALPYWRLVKRSWANKKEKKPVQRWKIVSKPATCKFTPFPRRCRVACESERHSTQESGRHLLKKTQIDGWNGWDRCGRCTVRGADWPQAATVTVGQPTSARWLWRRRYSNMPPPFTKWKTFPGAPHQELSNDTKFERHRQC